MRMIKPGRFVAWEDTMVVSLWVVSSAWRLPDTDVVRVVDMIASLFLWYGSNHLLQDYH